MKKIYKLFIFLSLELILLLFVLIFIPTLVIREKYYSNNSDTLDALPLNQGQRYFQTISSLPNLNSYSFYFKNPNLSNQSPINYILHSQSQPLIHQFTFSGANVGDPSWIRFKFNPINIDLGETLTVEIYSEVSPNQLQIVGNRSTSTLAYQTTSKITGVKTGFSESVNHLYQLVSHLQPAFLFIYLSLIALLNFLIFLSL